jgi:hypothetical protein
MTSTPGDGPQPPYDANPQPPGYGPPPGYASPGWQPAPPGYYPGPSPYRRPDHPDATKALVLGIVALLGGFSCYLPLLLGPWAWVVGHRAVKEIDAQAGRFEGRGQALAGYVMGVVATALLALGVLALIGLVVFLVVARTSSSGTGPEQSL